MKYYNQAVNIDTCLWQVILDDRSITTEPVKAILMLLYGAKGFESSGGAIASALGYSHHAPLNRIVPDFSKRILKKHDNIRPPLRADGQIRYWHIPFLGTEGGGKFSWILRHELAEAVSETFDTSPPEVVSPDEVSETDRLFIEGHCTQKYVNVYERDARARKACLDYYGYACSACGFDFEVRYGPLGRGVINVHHKRPLSSNMGKYLLDPIKDLVPVCPNCHTMIHSRKEPLSIEELRDLMAERNNTENG